MATVIVLGENGVLGVLALEHAGRVRDADQKHRVLVVRDDPEPHLAVVDQQQPLRLGGLEYLRMAHTHTLGGGRLGVQGGSTAASKAVDKAKK